MSTKITHLLFENPPFNQNVVQFLLEIPHLTSKSCIFSRKIPHLPPNHAFSLPEYPLNPKITHFLLENPPFQEILHVTHMHLGDSIIASQHGLGWKGPPGIIKFQSPASGRATDLQIWYYSRLPRAPSNLVLNTSRDGAST